MVGGGMGHAAVNIHLVFNIFFYLVCAQLKKKAKFCFFATQISETANSQKIKVNVHRVGTTIDIKKQPLCSTIYVMQ